MFLLVDEYTVSEHLGFMIGKDVMATMLSEYSYSLPMLADNMEGPAKFHHGLIH